MGSAAVLIGFVIGGGPSLLRSNAADLTVGAGAGSTTTTAAASTETTIPAAEIPTTTTPATTTTAAPVRPPAEVALRVYNGSTKAGAAVTIGDRLKKEPGYNVLAPGASPSDPLDATVVQFKDGFEAEARSLAELLALPASAVGPLPTPATFSGVGNADVILVVADDVVSP